MQAGEKWKRFKRAWDSYALATGLNGKDEGVQVATLLTVIGEEAREVNSTFTGWAVPGDDKKIDPVLEKFGQYCEPQKNIPFERYRFNRRCQEAGESYDQYRTALRKLAGNCEFGTKSSVTISCSVFATVRPEANRRDMPFCGKCSHTTKTRG